MKPGGRRRSLLLRSHGITWFVVFMLYVAVVAPTPWLGVTHLGPAALFLVWVYRFSLARALAQVASPPGLRRPTIRQMRRRMTPVRWEEP